MEGTTSLDTLVVDFETFEGMAVELEELQEQRFFAKVAQRLREGEAEGSRQSVGLEEAMAEEDYAAWLRLDPDAVSDEEIFR